MSYDGARTLGQYQLLSQLAVGGMAEIYVARTAGVGGFEKLVALKVIHPNFSADPDFVQMLVDEAKLSVQLQHANIVQTFDLGRVDEQYYIAMELIDGVDLYKLLRRASEHDIDFPFEIAAFIASETCAGLDYAHRKRDSRGRPLKIVHRDVSPQNILVSYDGEVKIVDFGIAKAAMRSQNTAAGVIKGKYYYMSPEQAWGDPIDARTDIFSAGILLYEMIVGQMLYLEEDIDKLLEVVRKASIAPPSSKRMGVPRELETIAMRALKKRADDRWPTAGELSTALTQFLHGFAPDFNRQRLATFVREVMGDDPTAQRRDPRKETAALARAGDVDVRDENSLLFRLRNAAPPPAAPAPRRADVATNVGSPSSQLASEFEEGEATIVDGGGDRLLALVNDEEGDAATRPGGPSLRRGTANAPSGRFDLGPDDPAADHRDADLEAPTVDAPRAAHPPLRLDQDEDDAPTGARPMPRMHATRPIESPPERDEDQEHDDDSPPSLPGMVPRQARATPLGIRTRSSQLTPTPTPQPDADEHAHDDDMGQPLRPTFEMRRSQAGDTDENPPVPHPDEDDSDRDARMELARNRAAASARPPTPQPAARTRPPTPPLGVPARPEGRSPTGGQQILKPEGRSPTGGQQILKPDGARPPSGAHALLKPAPQADAEAATLMMPPENNPVAASLQSVKPGAGNPKTYRTGEEEPTRIPPPTPPPPIDSGPAWPTVDSNAAFPFGSPLGDPAAERRRKRRRNATVYLGIAAAALLTAVIVGAFMLGSDATSRGTLSIISLPTGAEVRIDGNAAAQPTPVTLGDVDPRQTHHLRVSKSGYDVWEQDVRFPAGERTFSVQAVLMPTVGTVEITSTPPGAEAIVNGRIRGTTPTTVGDLPPNDDVIIELRLRGYKVAHKTVSWPPGANVGTNAGTNTRLIRLAIPLEKAK